VAEGTTIDRAAHNPLPLPQKGALCSVMYVLGLQTSIKYIPMHHVRLDVAARADLVVRYLCSANIQVLL
jgi:hypothetical protein